MRPTAARYVPPSRRGTTGNDAESAERRDLDGASSTAVSQVRLVALREGSIDISACPLDIEAQAGSDPASWTAFFPDRQPQELLGWFAEAFGGGAGRLEFPPSLSKRQRAWWHGLADRSRGLHAVSVGVGDERHLTITAPPPGGSGGDAAADPAARAGGQATSLTREQRQRAGQIYDCCQMEGGKFWERSRGEIEALVASQQPLPADLAELVHQRLRGQQVSELLRGGKPTEALALLSEDPRLAWVKDSQSGGYPAHIAAHKGYESVMYFLSSLPGVLEQRDGRRDTPLAVARRQRQSVVEEILLAAGAKPEVASKLESSSRPVTPAASTAAAAALDSSSGPEGQHCEYCSWSPEERHRYRQAGAGGGAPPGLQARGGSAAAQGSGSSADSRHKKAQGDQSRCPW